MSFIPGYGDEVLILIFDDPAEQERGKRPEFRSAQLYSYRVYTVVDLNLDAMPLICMLFRSRRSGYLNFYLRFQNKIIEIRPY
jgi:hypothetical protein